MADLRRAYLTSTNTSTSIQENMTLLAGKTQLLASNVIDRGLDLHNPSRLRFCLSQDLERRVTSTAMDMQELLKQASDLIRDRDSYFTIDPEQILLPAL